MSDKEYAAIVALLQQYEVIRDEDSEHFHSGEWRTLDVVWSGAKVALQEINERRARKGKP